MANVPTTRSRAMTTWPGSLMQTMLDDFFTGFPTTRQESDWMPRADIYEAENKYVMELDLPGLKREDVQVTCAGDILKISGKREQEREVNTENIHRMERVHGTFTRQFTIPGEVNPDQIKANMKDGVLKVEMPKTNQGRSQEKKISIE